MNADQKAASKRVVKENTRLIKAIGVRKYNKIKKAVATVIKNRMETNENVDNNPENTDKTIGLVLSNNSAPVEIDENAVTDTTTVNTADLTALILQNETLKIEVGQLVGLFKNFEGLLSGKGGSMALITLIPKLLSNQDIKNQIEVIYPIIEKYSK